MTLSYTQSVFQEISKKYFPYSSYNFNEEGNLNDNPITYLPDTYHLPSDTHAYLVKGGQFLYKADYRNPSDFDKKRWIIKNLDQYFGDNISLRASLMLNQLDYNLSHTPRLTGHIRFAIYSLFSGRIYNKASSVKLFGLMRAPRDEFSKLAYYIPADYLKYCTENHEALNKCFDQYLTAEMEEDREMPTECMDLYEDVNLSCGMRRMQVMSRVLSNFDSYLLTPSISWATGGGPK